MSLQVKGKLIQKLPIESGEGRNGRWEKQQFVIETDEQFPKKCALCSGAIKFQCSKR